jgi:GDPmannose 4,6-dehydratase
MPRALITGISGQDGAYLAALLLEKGYEVHGTTRASDEARLFRLSEIGVRERVKVHTANVALQKDAVEILDAVRPDELYHLASQSSVSVSFDAPAETLSPNIDSTIHLLDAVRREHREVRFYLSASGEMFGGDLPRPYTEADAFHPRSPYGTAKASAHWMTVNYRESYGVHACSGILFNHESPLRSETYVTRKITAAAARIAAGSVECLALGDVSVKRDWGYAPEYVQAMWLMLQRDDPADYIVSTGIAHSLEDFAERAFECVGLDWRDHTTTDAELFRTNEVRISTGDPARANHELGWRATTKLDEIIRIMVGHDQELASQGILQGAGAKQRHA